MSNEISRTDTVQFAILCIPVSHCRLTSAIILIHGQISMWISNAEFWNNNYWNYFHHTLFNASNTMLFKRSRTSEDTWVKWLKLGTNVNLFYGKLKRWKLRRIMPFFKGSTAGFQIPLPHRKIYNDAHLQALSTAIHCLTLKRSVILSYVLFQFSYLNILCGIVPITIDYL